MKTHKYSRQHLAGGSMQTAAKVAVIGAGGHGRVVISTLRANGYSTMAVFDDDASLWGTKILDITVRGPIALAVEAKFELGIVAIGDNAARRWCARSLNLQWLTVIHPAAWVAPDAKLGAGTVVFAGAVVQSGSVLGEHVIVNTSASVDHDCVVQDFVHLSPGVRLAGDVHIVEGTFIGTGGVVIPGRKIGPWTTIGAGAVVVRDIPGNVVAYGVPAKPVKKVSRNTAHGNAYKTPNVKA